ncbi:MAG TPA: cell division protein FtsB [Burkholderiales bacterium]|nr:cell division protein FtsB [Burkholderiales bacterium]
MKVLAGVLGALIVLIQYPLWLGKGGWLRAWHMEQELAGRKAKNAQLESRNAALAAEVRDLKQGTEAIEERARYELGMIRSDEVFFQIVEDKPNATLPQPAAAVRP